MCIQDHPCSFRITFEDIGMAGCMRDTVWLRNLVIPCHQSIFQSALYIDLPTVKLRCIKNVAYGKFGIIDWATYETKEGTIDVYVKRPILPGRNLLYEACIQKLVGERLEAIGFHQGTPRVLHIFSLRDESIGFAMEQIQGAVTLDRYLEGVIISRFSTVIIDCLLQLIAIIWYLNNVLGINHRDLKPSNFLIVERDAQRKVLTIENEVIEISSRYNLTLIDFGFSCIGSTKTHVADLSLSTVYSKRDPCPKEGRDLFLFLGLLYIEFYDKLSMEMRQLFESWLNTSGSNLCSFMCKDKSNYKKWLYFIAGNEEILGFTCSPFRILKDLQGIGI